LFDVEMLPFCGQTLRVRRRIERFVSDRNGKMIEQPSDCVTLEGVVCSGERSTQRWFRHRAIYSYWRECWLERVEATNAGTVQRRSSCHVLPPTPQENLSRYMCHNFALNAGTF
jgi:hypothetical protein